MIYHVRQLISLTLVRQESLLAFLVGLFAWFQDTRRVMMEQNHQTPKVNLKRNHPIYGRLPQNYHPYTNACIYLHGDMLLFGEAKQGTTQNNLYPYPNIQSPGTILHASLTDPQASSVSAPPCKVGGHWRLQNDRNKKHAGNPCKMYGF